MVFEDDVFFSLKPDEAEKNKAYLHTVYTRMTDPIAMFTVICTIIALNVGITYPLIRSDFRERDQNAPFWSMLIFTTLFIGVRLFHSLHLAKKDYSRLEFGIGDCISFGCVAIFTSGTLFAKFGDEPLAILALYVILSFIGVWHFYNLGMRRIPSDPRHHDIPIERRIQIVNSIVFALVFVFFILTFLTMMDLSFENEYRPCMTMAPILVLMIFNIAHSHQLTTWPKMLINNKHLSPEKITDRLNALAGVNGENFSKHPGLREAIKEYSDNFKSVSLRRARTDDVDYIVSLYISNFGYVIDMIADGHSINKEKLLRLCLTSSLGLGMIGYLRFYIVEIDDQSCGIIMPEFRTNLGIYNFLGRLSLLWILIRYIGPTRTLPILQNLGRLRQLEPEPSLKEIRINYFVIDDRHQRNGHASRVLKLIQQAFINSSTNDFHAQTISAYVRSDNVASVALFTKSGFTKKKLVGADDDVNIFSSVSGGLIKFTMGLR